MLAGLHVSIILTRKREREKEHWRSSAERCSSSKVLNTICSNCKSGDGQGDIQLQSPAVNKKLEEEERKKARYFVGDSVSL